MFIANERGLYHQFLRFNYCFVWCANEHSIITSKWYICFLSKLLTPVNVFHTWPAGITDHANSSIVLRAVVSQSLRIAGLKYVHEICCSWILPKLMRTEIRRIVRKYVTPRMKTYMCIGACLERHWACIKRGVMVGQLNASSACWSGSLRCGVRCSLQRGLDVLLVVAYNRGYQELSTDIRWPMYLACLVYISWTSTSILYYLEQATVCKMY